MVLFISHTLRYHQLGHHLERLTLGVVLLGHLGYLMGAPSCERHLVGIIMGHQIVLLRYFEGLCEI